MLPPINSFNTCYSIYNSQDNSLSAHCHHKSCFSSFTSNYNNGPWVFNKDTYMEVYYSVEQLEIENTSKWWIKCLNELGLKITETIKTRKDYKSLPPSFHIKNDQNFYVWKIDFKDYVNKAHVKIALYLLREFFGYGDSSHVYNSMLLQKKYPKELTKFNAFIFYTYANGGNRDHQLFSPGMLKHLFTNRRLKEILKNFQDSDNVNNNMMKMINIKPSYFEVNSDLKEYKKLIKIK